MQIKAVISDLDGTLLNSKGDISEYTHTVINKLKSKGITFLIATGRHYRSAEKIKKKLGLEGYLITSNGAEMYDESGNRVFAEVMPENLMKELIELPVDEEVDRFFISNDIFYHDKPMDIEDTTVEYRYEDFHNLDLGSCVNFAYMTYNPEKLLSLEEELFAKFPHSLAICTSMHYRLDVMKRGVSKANSVKKFLDSLGIELSEAIAFGDELNDLEMIDSVGQGFVMGNANYRLKEALPHIEVIETNDMDAVAKKIVELIL